MKAVTARKINKIAENNKNDRFAWIYIKIAIKAAVGKNIVTIQKGLKLNAINKLREKGYTITEEEGTVITW